MAIAGYATSSSAVGLVSIDPTSVDEEIGDLFLVMLSVNGNATFSTPDGWTLLISDSDSNVSGALYARKLDGTEGSTDFEYSPNSEHVAIYITINEVEPGMPIDVANYTNNSGNSATPTGPSRTANYDNSILFMMFAGDGGLITADAGYEGTFTGVAVQKSGGANEVCAGMQFIALDEDDSDDGTITGTGAMDWVAFGIIIRGNNAYNTTTSQYFLPANYRWIFGDTETDYVVSGENHPGRQYIITGPVPLQPKQWAESSRDDVRVKHSVNIEREIEEADSTLDPRITIDWRNRIEQIELISGLELGAVASPDYQFADLYNSSYELGPKTGIKITGGKLGSDGPHHVLMISEVSVYFIVDAATDYIYLYNAHYHQLFEDMSNNIPLGTYAVEQIDRTTDRLYVPDHFISAWHVREIVNRGLNRMTAEAVCSFSVPLFGLYDE